MAKARVGTKRRTLAELEAELEKRTAERDEAFAHEAAVAELLSVINFSPGDLTPVFDAILEKAMRLCGVEYGDLELYDGANFRAVATYGLSDAFAEQVRRGYLGADNPATRPLIAGERLSHIADLSTVDFSKVFKADPAADEAHQTLLCVPLRRDGRLLGMIASARKEVRPFSDKEIALLENFAAQAVIAMENARLITETQEALDQQTATAEVLGVINAHPGDLALVFDTMLERATRLCEAHTGHLFRFENNAFWRLASHGVPEDFDNMFPPGTPIPLLPHSSPPTRMVETRSVVHVPDSKEDESYRLGSPDMLAAVEAGILTVLFVPLLKEGEVVGHFTMHRMEVKPFTDKQIALLENFAAQAVIAMDNARLLDEIRSARDAAEKALRDLQAAQSSLVQAQKMAALGQLTAGIAHEIKNPLNFVNNFASLSTELLGELKEEVAPALAALGEDRRVEIDETIEMLTGNLRKIAEHGRRADNIVKSMLEHSRGASGERREVDLNNLIGEALNLAYHGARAQDQTFNIVLENDYEPMLRPIEVAPQEMTRVFLNLIGNGFYAANQRARENGDSSFQPLLKVTTRDLGDKVEVRVRDNGTGIPVDIRDKLFQPFFTTKPTGEGTGLGLSISYDIITQQHGGSIEVESEPDVFTEFTIHLPRQ